DGVWGKPKVRQPPRNRREKEAWVEVPPTSRDVGEAVAASTLALCGLPPNAAKGTGRFAIKVDGKPRNARLTLRSQGAARQLVIQIESAGTVYKRLADLGVPEPIATSLAALLAAERGLVLVSSPPGEGLTTTTDLVVESADRLLRDFISVEDAAQPSREIQNVKPVRFDARTGVTPLAALADAMREYPSAIVARDVRDKELVVELVRLAAEGKLVIVSLKASDAVEAITRVLGCGVEAKQLAGTLLGSLSQRLVRRLCPKCREETPPPPQLLTWLKLTAEQLPHIYKASEQGCRVCQGAGFLGRTGIFELASGAGLRRAIAAAGKPDQLRQAAAQEGMQPLRDASVQLVVAGVTSREEVHRALTGSASSPSSPPVAAVGKPRAAAPRGRTGQPPPGKRTP
ncbi:MAG: ATPase, T2SS/T4P/T4SS family, partial [Planctomycetota bacterium]